MAALLVASLPLGAAYAQNSVTYTYDTLGRVTSATLSDGSTTTYAYDAAGNRTQLAVTCNTCPLTANNVSVTVAENSSSNPIPLNITGTGTVASVNVSTAATHGTATASGASITYTPTSGYLGSDSFQYTATNAGGTSSPATVSVSVIAPLVANNVSATVAVNSNNNAITLSFSGGSPTSVAVASGPTHGSAAASGTSITYTPNGGYAGTDSFTYTGAYSAGTTAGATASITVLAPPIANSVSATVTENTSSNPIALNITGGAATSVAVPTQAGNGTATASGATITYTPTANYVGQDSFLYTASNSSGTSGAAAAIITVVPAVPPGTVLFQSSTPGSFSYTIPAGVPYVDIEGWGSGASAYSSTGYIFGYPFTMYYGGAGGAYFKYHVAVSQGQVISGAVDGANNAAATTVTTPSLSAGSGNGMTAGTASGGQTNTSGDAGGSQGGGAGNGGGDQTATNGNGTTPGGGGMTNTGVGANGLIKITARAS